MRDRLEEQRKARELNERLEQHMKKSLTSGKILALAWLVIGLLLLLLALSAEGSQGTLLLLLPGAVSVAAGLASLWVWRGSGGD